MDHDRLGLVVARRLVQTAVARNAVKRAIREAFRTRGAAQHGGGRDIVVQLRSRPDDPRALRAELASLLARVDSAPPPQ